MLASATPHLWSGKLIGAMAITFIVQGVTIAAYAARLAGVQTKRIATSISLFNLFVTTGRLANLFMLLFVGPLSDQAGNAVVDVAAWHRVFELRPASDRPCRDVRNGRLRTLPADVHLSLSSRRAVL